MNHHGQLPAAENPFSAGRVRPGALPFLFAGSEDTDQLIDRLRRSAWWGQILGPHGSGKSALLATLVPALERAGRRTLLIELHDAQRRLPPDWKQTPKLEISTVVVVDGYEQLSLWSRFRLKRFCRRRKLGLLVTAHAPVGLPDLFHTQVNLHLAQQIVDQLQRRHDTQITAEDVAERFSRHLGDMRETLFDLYDLHENRRGGS